MRTLYVALSLALYLFQSRENILKTGYLPQCHMSHHQSAYVFQAK